MAICMYNEHDRDKREAAHNLYMNSQNIKQLCQKAHEKGFRKALISEIHASAESHEWAPDLYCWAGGLWVKA